MPQGCEAIVRADVPDEILGDKVHFVRTVVDLLEHAVIGEWVVRMDHGHEKTSGGVRKDIRVALSRRLVLICCLCARSSGYKRQERHKDQLLRQPVKEVAALGHCPSLAHLDGDL